MTTFRFSSLAGLLALAACSPEISDEDLICQQTPGMIGAAGETAVDQLAVTEMCIHKWAYRLGRSSGSNAEIARATVGACREALDHLLLLKVEEGDKASEPFTDDKWQMFVKKFDELALFRVVQGRAGQCNIRGVDQK